MICNACSKTIQSIWDPSSPRRLRPGWDVTPEDKSLPPDHPENYVFGHHATSESLSRAISDGCTICQHIEPAVCLEEPEFTQGGYFRLPKYDQPGYFSVLGVRVELCMLHGLTEHQGSLGEFLCPVDSPKLMLSGSTGDASALLLVRRWLDTCLQTHKSCNKSVGEQPFVPPRLVQLDDATESFRVVPAAELAPGTRYATLTHCYHPDDEGIRLLESTIERLCVVQDNQADQQAHQDKVLRRDILSNGFCGIGDAGSTSSSSGLFTKFDRGPLAPDVFLFQPRADAPPSPHVLLSDITKDKLRAFRYEPISKSVQALRDRLLVPRMVYFGGQMLFWECHAAHHDELGPIPHLSPHIFGREGELAFNGSMPVVNLWKPLLEYSTHPLKDPVDQILNRWAAFVSQFSRLRPSPSERLPLLESLAMEVMQLLAEHGCEDTTYLAGMWRMSFPSALLWLTQEPAQEPPTASSTPSWSWASVDGEVLLERPKDTWRTGLLCELVDGAGTLGDDSRTIASASITLRGKLLRGRLAFLPDTAKADGWMWILSLGDAQCDTAFRLENGPVQFPIHDDCTARFDVQRDMKEEALLLPVKAETEDYGSFEQHMLLGILISRLGDGRYVRQESILVEYTEFVLHGKPGIGGVFKKGERRALEKIFAVYANPDNRWDRQSLESFLITRVPQDRNHIDLFRNCADSCWTLTTHFAQWPFNTTSTSPLTSLTFSSFARAMAFLSGGHCHMVWPTTITPGEPERSDLIALEYIFRALATTKVVDERSDLVPEEEATGLSRQHRDIFDVLYSVQPVMNFLTWQMEPNELIPTAMVLSPPPHPELSALIIPAGTLISLLDLLIPVLDRAREDPTMTHYQVLIDKLKAAYVKLQSVEGVSFDDFTGWMGTHYELNFYTGISVLFRIFL
ncbi:unnamed protein product [Clonostachys solani]|uniref:Uncharacterized protein n=1 Tax=Clonostachys solani TaxID=160281 RepID=A0A9N9Z4P1_9HYPO|nr:unnamed protein product [Clonostachys solani]